MANVKRAATAAQPNPPGRLRPIRRESLNQQILSRLRAYLDHDQLRVGSRLPSERDLASMLRVSRPSIREVLKALSIMGIVKSKHGKGTYLTARMGAVAGDDSGTFNFPERLDLAEVAEARCAIEPVVASLAARRASDMELRAIFDEFKAMQDHVKNPRLIEKHDQNFHILLYQASGNAVLRNMLTPVLEHQFLYRQRLHRAGIPSDTLMWHQNIVRALRKRSSRAAYAAMKRHMEGVRAYYHRVSRDGGKANQS